MALRITTYEQLLELQRNAADEDDCLDYKGNEKGEKWWDVAEDIAAFANTLGGVLLVGVAQDKLTRKIKLHGLSDTEYATTKTHYENALRTNVSPPPMVTYADPIPLPGGRVVLAVHVDPYIAGLVGAMYPDVDRGSNFKVSGAWQFPIRKGGHNVALTPAQIPLYMPIQVRRMVVLLERLKTLLEAADPPRLCQWQRNPTPSTPDPGCCKNLRVDVEGNVLQFDYHPDASDTRGKSQTVPLDDIETIFRSSTGKFWYIRWAGVIRDQGGNRGFIYTSH